MPICVSSTIFIRAACAAAGSGAAESTVKSQGDLRIGRQCSAAVAPRSLERYSQLSFSKASELIRDGAPNTRCRPIIDRVSSKALANRIDGAVCARSRHTFLRARTASFVGKPERQLQLQDRMRVEI